MSSPESVLQEVGESLGVTLWRHTTDRASILKDWLAEMLKFLPDRVACEYVDDSHVVDVLLVWA